MIKENIGINTNEGRQLMKTQLDIEQEYFWPRVGVFEKVMLQETFWDKVNRGCIPRPKSGYMFLLDNHNLLAPVRITHTQQHVTPVSGYKKKMGTKIVIEYGGICYDYHALQRLNERGTYGTVPFTAEYLWREEDRATFRQIFLTVFESPYTKMVKQSHVICPRLENSECLIPHHHGAWCGYVNPTMQCTKMVLHKHQGMITSGKQYEATFAVFNAKTWLSHDMMNKNQLAICRGDN